MKDDKTELDLDGKGKVKELTIMLETVCCFLDENITNSGAFAELSLFDVLIEGASPDTADLHKKIRLWFNRRKGLKVRSRNQLLKSALEKLTEEEAKACGLGPDTN